MSCAVLDDQYGRTVSYMRISVTDRCNLRCAYCVNQDMRFIPHPNILRYEEILALLEIVHSLGVKKIRFTGGEPFVRKGFTSFLVGAAEKFPDIEFCVTTNGTLIGSCIDSLAKAGIRLNISLDTLRPDRFREITGTQNFQVVQANIKNCLQAAIPLKINVVAMKGVNDDELPQFVQLAQHNPLDLRFIEFMPIGDGTRWAKERVWLSADIIRDIKNNCRLEALVGAKANAGPARMFNLIDGAGRIGVISPYSNHFCATCNRLRLTSDGDLRACLFSDRVFHLRTILRNPTLGAGAVEHILRVATKEKPMGHRLLESMDENSGVCHTQMSAIGG